MSKMNESFDSVLTIINLTKFKQDLNENIDKCILDLQENGSSVVNVSAISENNSEKDKNNSTNNNVNLRIINQTMTYYERMKQLYSCKQANNDEDDDEDGFINDEDEENNDSDCDYSDIMEGRIFRNDLSRQENEIRRKLLGLDYSVD